MNATICERPATFGRVDLIKAAIGDAPLPGDEKLWILGGDLIFEVDAARRCVPRGFVTDASSIPSIARTLTGAGSGKLNWWAVVVHDWLYCEPDVSKRYADLVLRSLLDTEGASAWVRNVMYLSVRWLAGAAYSAANEVGPRLYLAEGSR